jgi:hypothetical protein
MCTSYLPVRAKLKKKEKEKEEGKQEKRRQLTRRPFPFAPP